MLSHYILRGKEPIEVSKAEWSEWRDKADRQVARTDIAPGLWVSTLFTGLALPGNPSSLFETAVCGPNGMQNLATYATWAEAEQGHQQAVLDVRLVQRMS